LPNLSSSLRINGRAKCLHYLGPLTLKISATERTGEQNHLGKKKLKTIETAFIEEGYVSIPFSFNGAGHPIIEVIMPNNVQAKILLDTGASANLLDYDFAKQLGLNLTPTQEKGGGIGGLTLDVFSIDEVLMEMSGQHFRFDNFLSMDFTSLKQSLISNGLAADFQGILGFGFFKMTKCFIDYSGDRILILNN
jgi:hypothetical protein